MTHAPPALGSALTGAVAHSDALDSDAVIANPLAARLALRHHLLQPDGRALLADSGQPAHPAALAASLGVALAGGGAFAGVCAVAFGGHVGGGGVLELAPPILGALLLAGLLTFPPFLLVHSLLRRSGSVLHLAAAAAVGPAVCGTWLGATAPVLLLYGLTSTVGLGFVLMTLLLAGLAFVAGGVATARRALRASATTPGVLVVLAHYALTTWTAAVLVAHLS